MEEELKCPFCRKFFEEPILLSCGHCSCRQCALKNQNASVSSTRPCTPGHFPPILSPISPQPSSSSASDSISLCVSDHDQESDKLSIVSESDSGVVIFSHARNSRPSSMVGVSASASRLPSILTPSASGVQITCGVCNKNSYFTDEASVQNAPVNIAVRNVVQRYQATTTASTSTAESTVAAANAPRCEFCMDEKEKAIASVCCLECKYAYCKDCFTSMHPNRGPFAGHTIVPASSRPLPVSHDVKCGTHRADSLSMYCTPCKQPVCCQCLQDARHANHDVQPLDKSCKAQKAELSQTLQLLSEKAKAATEDIGRLKQLQDVVNNNCNDFKSMVCIEVDRVIEELQARKEKLLRHVDEEKEYKRRILHEQIGRCTAKLNRTTGLIKYCIEILKEPDAAAYLQISSALLHRSNSLDLLWHNEMKTRPETDADFVLTLDTKHLQYAIRTLDFAQRKVPSPPMIDAPSCSAENNSVTVVWRPRNDGCAIDGFVLEIDNGRDEGCFKEVYSGPEMMCTLDGLHFNTIYNARVKAFNAAGESAYSDPICLQTAQVAWFQLTKSSSQRDIHLSNECSTFSTTSLDYQTILGSISFAKGVHYWEVTVDEYDGRSDIVVGVAQHSVNRNIMLGTDLHGWSMYIDNERSWFHHNQTHHNRIVGGIRKGDVIGVRLDCDRGSLEFTVNDKKRVFEGNPIAFAKMPRIRYYPAFSINCKSTITVHTAIPPPISPSTDSD